MVFTVENGKLTVAPKNDPLHEQERQRLEGFMARLRRIEGTGDPSIDADVLMGMTRDR
ncbi:AbrB/MazE/SpoVT family DNA-binding domain-containing protein [Pseudorhizobium endolithicum]|uniref:AbrB/MazE/SpoVT family DNA-binding domain-containing protein n=1 Tax=Pseudorhizobium endolithicum TaxID=1191678 RepID=A0ABN7JPS9_9HYPH|nr:hypothetical protein [Pseudorhizobium endolithicum]CAD6408861.1 AbrB/MazE/SpoVT family DNA-binding domain-containing protein [Rhizobium sp. Q54]CAD7041373.1 AbrB/MazE/SpoVT family DNA-binding domain-containing protein [Pseudorhizobium endolithicum]